MKAALNEAREAYDEDEIPIGAVIVYKDKIIAASHNRNRKENNPVKHAEILAIEIASQFLKNERLTGCHLFVTKEPCAMCAGAIIHARIESVNFGARDYKYGACGTVLNVCGNDLLNHVPEIESGILEDESAELLKKFFQGKRKKQKKFDN